MCKGVLSEVVDRLRDTSQVRECPRSFERSAGAPKKDRVGRRNATASPRRRRLEEKVRSGPTETLGGRFLVSRILSHLRSALQQRRMTPAELMWHRSEPAINFESDIEDAKRMFKERPELVQPEAAEAKVDDFGHPKHGEPSALDIPKGASSVEDQLKTVRNAIAAAQKVRKSLRPKLLMRRSNRLKMPGCRRPGRRVKRLGSYRSVPSTPRNSR